MLPAQLLSRFSRQLFPSSKSTATFHLLIQRLRFVLFLPKIRVSLSVSSSVNTFSYFPLFFPSLVLSALVFSGKSWWKVQVSTLTSARELAVTDFFLRIIRVLFLCVFSFSFVNLHEYLTYIDNRNSDLLFKDYQNDHKFTITTYTSTGVVRFYLFFYLSLKYIFLFKFDYGKCFVFVFRYSLFFKKKSLLFVHFLETLSGGAFRIIELEALLIVLFFFFFFGMIDVNLKMIQETSWMFFFYMWD